MKIKLGSGITSRVLAALSNFILTWFLINNLTLENFGYFSTIFTLCVFISGLFSAFFVSQMVVLGSGIDKSNKVLFASRYLHAIKFSLLIFAIILFLFVYIFGFLKSREIAILFIMAILALWSLVLREFFTASCYFVEKSNIPILANCSGLLALVLYLFFFEPNRYILEITFGLEIIVIYIIPGLVIHTYILLRSNVNDYKLPLNELFSSSFQKGKWALLQGLFYFIRTQSRTLVSIFMLSAWHVGVINSAYLIVALPIVVISGLVQQALPQLTKISSATKQFGKQIIFFITIIIGITVFYAFSVVIFYDLLKEQFFSEEILSYTGFSRVVYCWLIVMFLQCLNMGMFTVIQSMGQFRLLAGINLGAATISIVASAVGAFYFNLNGIMGAIILVEFYVFGRSFITIKRRFSYD